MIKKLCSIFVLILGLNAYAEAVPLRVGDILLQPLLCWSCSLIEAEEGSIYSHMGIVIQVSPEVLVAESWHDVILTPLETFKNKTESGQAILVRRYQNGAITQEFEENALGLKKILQDKFLGKKYDSDFLWNNFDINGDELIYCSELISKLLQAFVGLEVPLKRMQFKVNREMWERYFHGKGVPVGEWGVSPGDYEKSELFYSVGEL